MLMIAVLVDISALLILFTAFRKVWPDTSTTAAAAGMIGRATTCRRLARRTSVFNASVCSFCRPASVINGFEHLISEKSIADAGC